MPLPNLVPSPETVTVQSTTLSVDVLGRYVCNTWEEATANGGPPFDVIMAGAGMYGAYCAAKIYRLAPTKRILVLDAGPLLISEHIQNLARIGLNVPAAIPPASDPGVARDLVWGIPWRGNVAFPGLAYCMGGKSLYWGGWCPRLTGSDLQNWPQATAQYLTNNYPHVEEEIGVTPTTDFITGPLYNALRTAFIAAGGATANVEVGLGNNGVEEAPLAVQGAPPASSLFSFDKYSSAPILTDAIREDSGKSGGNDANRRLFLVPRAHVVKLHAAHGGVHTVEVDVSGQQKFLGIPPTTAVVLATSTIETTRLALHSFPTALMGRNLMAHVRSDFTVRILRSALPPLPVDVETAALLVRGVGSSGRFHVQITASANPNGSDELLFRMIPDLDFLDEQLLNDDPNWITMTLRGIGEMHGDTGTPVPNGSSSWINLSPFETDEFGVPRAYVHFLLSGQDIQTWMAMDQTAVALAQAVAGAPGNIQYFYDGGWQTTPFPLHRPFPEWHRGLGTTYHEAGTLWMGDAASSSVTNSVGRFHHIQNAYACDQAAFASVGSVNPALTGLTLARQLAEHLAS
jgi:choline dehydrogenase-like flavoprotein